jgi:hypothetical protein
MWGKSEVELQSETQVAGDKSEEILKQTFMPLILEQMKRDISVAVPASYRLDSR